jgi:uncharacterized protein YoxC
MIANFFCIISTSCEFATINFAKLKGGKIDMIIDISVAVIALAFVALVIYLIVMIKSLRVTLGQVNQTLVEARKQLGEVGTQAQKVIEQTNQISVDLKQKVDAFNPIFNAVNQAGQILEHKATALKKDFLDTQEELSSLAADGEKKKRAPQTKGLMTMAAILELAGIGVGLWEKLKKRR